MTIIKKISLVILIIFYLVAGFNHFRSPTSYYRIIPPYLPWPATVNILAGIFEVLFAVMAIFKTTRHYAGLGLILMLVAFVPTHVYMLQKAPMQLGNITVTPLIACIRLVILQPLLMLWAWYTCAMLKTNKP